MIHRTSRLRAIGEDAVLLGLPVMMFFVVTPSAWLWLLGAASVSVLTFNAITLHFPREVVLDDTGFRMRAYGREHTYEWEACRLRVRRFLVRDRVMLRVEDVKTGRSHRYWLTTQLSDYDALVRDLTSRCV